MRGIRFASVSLAALLACVAIGRIFHVEPASGNGADSLDQPGTPAAVPPPPPVLDPAPAPRAKPQPARVTVPPQPQVDRALPDAAPDPSAAPVILDAATHRDITAEVTGKTAAPEVSDGTEAEVTAEAAGPVIVVPHERPKQENRGARWLKSVGHALGIGGDPDPAEQAFR